MLIIVLPLTKRELSRIIFKNHGNIVHNSSLLIATPNGILINGIPLSKTSTNSLSPYVKRASELLKEVKSEEWESTKPHQTNNIPTLAKVNMLLALAPENRVELCKAGFNEDEPRDERGRWTDGGDSVMSGTSSISADIQTAISHLNQATDDLKARQISQGNQNSFGEGKCATYVRQALNTAGFDVTQPEDGGHGFAKNYGSSLENAGFTAIATWDKTSTLSSDGYIAGYIPQAGDVVVMQNYVGGNEAGHMAMYSGSQWVSDFKQNSIWAGYCYRTNKPNYVIYRNNN